MSGAKPHIVIGVTGSIAAYKACELVRLCDKQGWDVSVVMTESATKFVTALTFQTLSRNPVGVDAFAEPQQWMPEHIGFADRATVFVVAPCTANVIAKMAHGIADDMLTAALLATRAPLLVAPAMNVHMWDNPATQRNIAQLRQDGVTVMDAGEGDLACGYTGRGRMPEPAAIVAEIALLLS